MNNKLKNQNRYTTEFNQTIDDAVYTVKEWKELLKAGYFCNDDGYGYWMKNGMKSDAEVFSTPQLDATHVIWYNK